jgi:hypothetical protein
MTQPLSSEKVVLASPFSFSGSLARIEARVPNPVLAGALVVVAWTLVAAWYLLVGLVAWPWRLLRRGQRAQRLEQLRHRELVEAARAGRR